MSAYVALLRAVNVGGHAPLSMAELRRSLEGLGLRGVHTYLQSGNVVFDTDDTLPTAVAAAIEVRIERDFGPRIGVRVLSAAEIARVVGANPFAGAPGADEKALHATFVISAASKSDFRPESDEAFDAVCRTAFDEIVLPTVEGERAALVGPPTLATPVIYLHLPHGYGRTKLNNAFFERALGAAATTRNWRTVRTLAGLSAGQ